MADVQHPLSGVPAEDLLEDPVITAMANDLRPHRQRVLRQCRLGDGRPTTDFMLKSTDQYIDRGGRETYPRIDAVAKALLTLIQEETKEAGK